MADCAPDARPRRGRRRLHRRRARRSAARDDRQARSLRRPERHARGDRGGAAREVHHARDQRRAERQARAAVHAARHAGGDDHAAGSEPAAHHTAVRQGERARAPSRRGAYRRHSDAAVVPQLADAFEHGDQRRAGAPRAAARGARLDASLREPRRIRDGRVPRDAGGRASRACGSATSSTSDFPRPAPASPARIPRFTSPSSRSCTIRI